VQVLVKKVGGVVASKAEEAARAADASVKYWLGEAERTNKEAVEKVNFKLPSLPSTDDITRSLAESLPKPELKVRLADLGWNGGRATHRLHRRPCLLCAWDAPTHVCCRLRHRRSTLTL
jgi:hypothetical protein